MICIANGDADGFRRCSRTFLSIRVLFALCYLSARSNWDPLFLRRLWNLFQIAVLSWMTHYSIIFLWRKPTSAANGSRHPRRKSVIVVWLVALRLLHWRATINWTSIRLTPITRKMIVASQRWMVIRRYLLQSPSKNVGLRLAWLCDSFFSTSSATEIQERHREYALLPMSCDLPRSCIRYLYSNPYRWPCISTNASRYEVSGCSPPSLSLSLIGVRRL